MCSFLNCISKFSKSVFRRINSGIFTSEDNIRYYFVNHVLNEYNLDLDTVILEEKYGDIVNASTFLKSNNVELDVHVKSDKINLYVELKYHSDSGQKNPKEIITTTDNCGAIINDLLRLSTIKNDGKRMLVYVFKQKMFNYINNCFNKRYFDILNDFILNKKTTDLLCLSASKKALSNIDKHHHCFF